MRRLMMVLAASVALVLAAAGPSVAQESGPTPGPTPYYDFPTVGPTPYFECPTVGTIPYDVAPLPYEVGPTPYYVGPRPYFVVCEAATGGGASRPLPQTGTSLALIAGAGVVVMGLGLWAARRRAAS
ncbi:MAG TPA: LPXTG cell wall anchor domain-containing protein [Actinomycetota bacterium]|nr:LPXTG cell wall anchor domain-containing protein [Actinomycetota bacterium]